MKFKRFRVPVEKDLIHYIEEKLDKDVIRKIGENPLAWIDELNIISHILTREPLSAGTGINYPPINDPEFRRLGPFVYLYRGDMLKLRGLWLRNKKDPRPLLDQLEAKQFSQSAQRTGFEDPLAEERMQWTQYNFGFLANLEILEELESCKDLFLPKNFKPRSRSATKQINGRTEPATKRPILIFSLGDQAEAINVYAKGSFLSSSFYYTNTKPSYRLTCLASMSRVTSRKELKIMRELETLGVHVPRILGYYEAPFEEFLFMEEVKGDHPDKFITTHRDALIDQDAEILAALCLAGYHKQGFSVSWDDKVFDGRNLYLIDVDESSDLYGPFSVNYRELLLDPNDATKLTKFREQQKRLFERHLKDALFDYRDSLINDRASQERYVRRFYQKLGWQSPNFEDLDRITQFGDNYTTLESEIGSLMDDE
jgi:hypothetical protein